MTVEAVPALNAEGKTYPEGETKVMHTTMQTLGRFAIISSLIVVSLLNIYMFSGIEDLTKQEKVDIYADIYLLALAIPMISVTGVILGAAMQRRHARRLQRLGVAQERIERLLLQAPEKTEPNWWIFGGSLAFVALTLTVGLEQLPFAQEIVFVGSMIIVLFLMHRLIQALDPSVRRASSKPRSSR